MIPSLVEIFFHKRLHECSEREQYWIVMGLHNLANEIEKGGHRQTILVELNMLEAGASDV